MLPAQSENRFFTYKKIPGYHGTGSAGFERASSQTSGARAARAARKATTKATAPRGTAKRKCREPPENGDSKPIRSLPSPGDNCKRVLSRTALLGRYAPEPRRFELGESLSSRLLSYSLSCRMLSCASQERKASRAARGAKQHQKTALESFPKKRRKK